MSKGHNFNIGDILYHSEYKAILFINADEGVVYLYSERMMGEPPYIVDNERMEDDLDNQDWDEEFISELIKIGTLNELAELLKGQYDE